MPTREAIHLVALENFPHTIILLEVYQMEGFSNWIKIEKLVSNYKKEVESKLKHPKCKRRTAKN